MKTAWFEKWVEKWFGPLPSTFFMPEMKFIFPPKSFKINWLCSNYQEILITAAVASIVEQSGIEEKKISGTTWRRARRRHQAVRS